MKHTILAYFLFLLPFLEVQAQTQTQTFGYTGSVVNWTVPDGVTKLQVTIRGGAGGKGGDDGGKGGQGGGGAVLTGYISVVPNTVIQFAVGNKGAVGGTGGSGYKAVGGDGGTNPLGYTGGKGGNQGPYDWSGAGGGGGAASVLRVNGVDYVAGGGGGGGGGGWRCPVIPSTGGDGVARAIGDNSNLKLGIISGGNGLPPSGLNIVQKIDGAGSGGGGGGVHGGSGGDATSCTIEELNSGGFCAGCNPVPSSTPDGYCTDCTCGKCDKGAFGGFAGKSTDGFDLSYGPADVDGQITISYVSCVCLPPFRPDESKKYVVSAWVKVSAACTKGYDGDGLEVSFDGQLPQFFQPSGAVIEGWQRIYGEFKTPPSYTKMSVKLHPMKDKSAVYFDDLRIHPFLSSFKSYVYDDVNNKLSEELDDNNYFTRYEYDQSGALERVKKETERGVMMVQESRAALQKSK